MKIMKKRRMVKRRTLTKKIRRRENGVCEGTANRWRGKMWRSDEAEVIFGYYTEPEESDETWMAGRKNSDRQKRTCAECWKPDGTGETRE